jgi:hypothetical protein
MPLHGCCWASTAAALRKGCSSIEGICWTAVCSAAPWLTALHKRYEAARAYIVSCTGGGGCNAWGSAAPAVPGATTPTAGVPGVCKAARSLLAMQTGKDSVHLPVDDGSSPKAPTLGHLWVWLDGSEGVPTAHALLMRSYAAGIILENQVDKMCASSSVAE